jgi:2-polyprenyl-3-methyl-5-hydroxy-6-metoxy-1,4-benzoquinol methylase
LTYRKVRLRNVPHLKRLHDIRSLVVQLQVAKDATYADFGCSNGYVTDEVRKALALPTAHGFDRVCAHFEEGQRRHPHLQFALCDLAEFDPGRPQFDVVTCFETMEHVGDLTNAMRSFIHAIKPGGVGLLSAPIEIGLPGIVKFIVKVSLYRYSLNDLPQRPNLRRDYVKALLRGERISRFRSDGRSGWGTHFGFDVRDVDDLLAQQPALSVVAKNKGFTRFWIVRKSI